jgi:hypothetical protein
VRVYSAKRRAEIPERRLVVACVFARDLQICQAKHAPGDCAGVLDPHELIPRSVWRRGYLVVENVISVCRRHHDWIDDHPDDAELLGLHARSWQRNELDVVHDLRREAARA